MMTHYGHPVEHFHTHQRENNQQNSPTHTHAENRRDFELIALAINRPENAHLIQRLPRQERDHAVLVQERLRSEQKGAEKGNDEEEKEIEGRR